MASPGHPAYAGSASYRKNFDRDVHADTGIFNRLKATTLTVTGSMTVVGNACFPNGSAAAPGIAFCTEATGYYIDNTDTLYTTITGSHILNIQKDTGNATIEAAQTRALTLKSFDNAGGLSTVAQLFSGDATSSGFVNIATGDGTASSGTVVIRTGTAGNAEQAGDIHLRVGDDGGGAADDASEIHFRGDGSNAVHLVTRQTTIPTAFTANMTVVAGSTDACGQISVNWGGVSAETVTFARTWSTIPYVIITPISASAITAGAYVSTVTSNSFTLTNINPAAAAGFYYFCIAGRNS